MKSVYAFTYDRIDEPVRELGHPKYLVATDIDDATTKAKQFLVDDHLNEPGQAPQWELTSVRRGMQLDWPIGEETEVEARALLAERAPEGIS